VSSLIGAGPSARATKTSFEPDYRYQQREFDRAFAEDSRVAYLGDWHSHPGGASWPSQKDKRTLTTITATSAEEAPGPWVIIIGGRGFLDLRAFTSRSPASAQQDRLRIIGRE